MELGVTEGWVEDKVGVVVGIWDVAEELDGLFDVVGFAVELVTEEAVG